ncbi:MAG: hypothetical protein ABI690_13640 [Chloroflexota bacterium]
MSMINPAVGRAMADQVKRTRREPTDAERLHEALVENARLIRELALAHVEIKRLNAENDKLAVRAHRAPKTNAGGAGTFINGRKVVNQVEAAKHLGVKQYQISRWLKAGKFEKVEVPGHKLPSIYADSLHKPERGQPGRKKK